MSTKAIPPNSRVPTTSSGALQRKQEDFPKIVELAEADSTFWDDDSPTIIDFPHISMNQHITSEQAMNAFASSGQQQPLQYAQEPPAFHQPITNAPTMVSPTYTLLSPMESADPQGIGHLPHGPHQPVAYHTTTALSQRNSGQLRTAGDANHRNGFQSIASHLVAQPPTSSGAYQRQQLKPSPTERSNESTKRSVMKHMPPRAAVGSGSFLCGACNRHLSSEYSLRRHAKVCSKLSTGQALKQKNKDGVRKPRKQKDDIRSRRTAESLDSSLEVIPPDPDSTQQNILVATKASDGPTGSGVTDEACVVADDASGRIS